MPETIEAVWTAVAQFYATGLSTALATLTAIPILVAPIIIWISAKVLGQGKSLLRLGGGRRRG